MYENWEAVYKPVPRSLGPVITMKTRAGNTRCTAGSYHAFRTVLTNPQRIPWGQDTDIQLFASVFASRSYEGSIPGNSCRIEIQDPRDVVDRRTPEAVPGVSPKTVPNATSYMNSDASRPLPKCAKTGVKLDATGAKRTCCAFKGTEKSVDVKQTPQNGKPHAHAHRLRQLRTFPCQKLEGLEKSEPGSRSCSTPCLLSGPSSHEVKIALCATIRPSRGGLGPSASAARDRGTWRKIRSGRRDSRDSK